MPIIATMYSESWANPHLMRKVCNSLTQVGDLPPVISVFAVAPC